jgi:hypothetical protein
VTSPPGKTRSVRGGQFRVHDRKNVRLRALVTHIEAGWQRHVGLANVGLGGACILIDETVHVGDRVTLSFVAPTLWDPLVLRAKVVWTRQGTPGTLTKMGEPGRCGVAFEHRTPQAVLALFELIGTVAYDA